MKIKRELLECRQGISPHLEKTPETIKNIKEISLEIQENCVAFDNQNQSFGFTGNASEIFRKILENLCNLHKKVIKELE